MRRSQAAALVISAAGTVLKCNAGASGQQFQVAMSGTFPAGAVFKIYPNSTNSGDYVLWTPNDTVGSPYTGRIRVVGTQTADIMTFQLPYNCTPKICRAKNAAGAWMLGGSAAIPFTSLTDAVGVFISTPTVNTFTLEVVSTPSPISITGIVGTQIGTTKCPGTCVGVCPIFNDSANFSMTLSGAGATCLGIAGTYTFSNVDYAGGCTWVKGGTGGGIGFSLNYNSGTNQTNVVLNAGGGSTNQLVTGYMDGVNGFGAITPPTMVIATPGPCTGLSITASLTGLGGG